MDILSEIKRIFNVANLNVSERVFVLELSFDIKGRNFPIISAYKALFHIIPERDTLEITVTVDSGDNIRILRTVPFPEQEYAKLLEDVDADTTADVKIEIKKEVQNSVFSIYSLDNFCADLLSLSIVMVMRSFSKILKDQEHMIFEIFEGNYIFATETMVFISDRNSLQYRNFARLQRITECGDITNFYNQSTYELLPDDFFIIIDYEGNPLSKVFGQICSILSLIYIANTSIIEDDVYKIQIIGQRKVEYKYPLSNTVVNPEFYKIYNWVYTDGNSVDKSIIARNIISLHCRYTSLGEIDDKTFSSIQSNYKIYLKENVNQYIELKNKVAQFICDVVSKTGDYATLLLHNLKNNLLAIFGFLFTVILANIVSEQPLENIFTRDITVILEVVLAGSLIYLIICNFETRYKLKKVADSYHALKKNYDNILSDIDLQEIFNNDKLLNDTVKSVKRGIWVYTTIWLLFLLGSLIILENVSCCPVIRPWLSVMLQSTAV